MILEFKLGGFLKRFKVNSKRKVERKCFLLSALDYGKKSASGKMQKLCLVCEKNCLKKLNRRHKSFIFLLVLVVDH